MKAVPLNEEMSLIAAQIIWFEPPAKALADPVRFMAYAMTYAMHEEMRVIRQYVSDDDFREALDHAPPGIIDPRSWAYWNSKMGRYPPPPLPLRRFGDVTGPDKMEFAPYGSGRKNEACQACRLGKHHSVSGLEYCLTLPRQRPCLCFAACLLTSNSA